MRKIVLIVEDGEAEVRGIKAALRDGNVSNPVLSVPNGDKARELLMDESGRSGIKVAIVLLNIHSSRVCGLEFLDWLREQEFFSELLLWH